MVEYIGNIFEVKIILYILMIIISPFRMNIVITCALLVEQLIYIFGV